MADIVAKRFCPSDRARLIQAQAPMRNIDSNSLLRRFDCCRFLFHRAFAATFATISARLRHADMSVSCRLMPTYAKDGNAVCFFQSAQKFKTNYFVVCFLTPKLTTPRDCELKQPHTVDCGSTVLRGYRLLTSNRPEVVRGKVSDQTKSAVFRQSHTAHDEEGKKGETDP